MKSKFDLENAGGDQSAMPLVHPSSIFTNLPETTPSVPMQMCLPHVYFERVLGKCWKKKNSAASRMGAKPRGIGSVREIDV